MCAPVLIEKHRRVTLLRLASDNPCNPPTDALGRIDADDPVHATFITGSDKTFAAGADSAAMSALTYAGPLSRPWATVCYSSDGFFHAGFALHDQKEGMAAFLQKRAPEFLNK